MNVKTIAALAAATLFSIAAHAHDCSGGASGGMDATGNQCNGEVIFADPVTNMPAATSQLAPGANSAHAKLTKVSTATHAKSKNARHTAGAKRSAHG